MALATLLIGCDTGRVAGDDGDAAPDPERTAFIRPFQIYIGHGRRLSPEDAELLGRFDLVVTTRWRYDEIDGHTWTTVHDASPETEIYVYMQGIDVWRSWDAEGESLLADEDVKYLNNIARYRNARGHSMGNLDDDNPDLFLLDAVGRRCHTFGTPNRFLMDFGSRKFQRYWFEAVDSDILSRPWVADGVYMDNAGPYLGVVPTDIPARYDTDAKWSAAMLGHVTRAAERLHARGQELFVNGGGTATRTGSEVWTRLDRAPYRPDVMLEEGAFAHGWGRAEVTFYSEEKWRSQVDLLGAIRNYGLAYATHARLEIGAESTDNYGRPVDAWQVLWYGLASFLLGRDADLGNAYFTCGFSPRWVRRLAWYDEYAALDLGAAKGPYRVTALPAGNVYWREFEDGYAFVNPGEDDLPAVPLPETCKLLTHDNFEDDPATLADQDTVALPAHHGVLLLKSRTRAEDRGAGRR